MREFYDKYVRQSKEQTKQHESRRRAAQLALEEAQREENSYLDAMGRSEESYREVLLARAQAAHKRVEEQDEALVEVERLLVEREKNLTLIESFIDVSQRAAGKLETASPEDKRLALRLHDVQVKLWEKGHKPPYATTWLGGIDPTIYDMRHL
jgi:seryl-tRNA synthetase